MNFSAQLKGMDELLADLAALKTATHGQVLRSGLRAAGNVLVADAKANVSSRRVKRALRVIASYRGASAQARIGPQRKTKGARIAHLIEKGTRPHVIRAKKAKVLGGKGRVFGKAVQHPGSRPRPYLLPALPRKRTEAERKFASAIRKHIENLKLRALKRRLTRVLG